MPKSPDNSRAPKREKIDPTKDPEFQGVVKHFLNTPPATHKPKGEKSKASRETPPKAGSR